MISEALFFHLKSILYIIEFTDRSLHYLDAPLNLQLPEQTGGFVPKTCLKKSGQNEFSGAFIKPPRKVAFNS